MLIRQSTQIAHFTPEMAETCAAIPANAPVDQDLMSQLEIIFKSLACMNASFQDADVGKQSCTERHSNVDMVAAQAAFEKVALIEHEALKQIVWSYNRADGGCPLVNKVVVHRSGTASPSFYPPCSRTATTWNRCESI